MPTPNGCRCGTRSLHQCPAKSRISRALWGSGNAITQSLTAYGSTPLLITFVRALISPPAVISMVISNVNSATSSTASTSTEAGPALITVAVPSVEVTGVPSTRTSVAVNLGDQSRPLREPLSPGRPTQPVQCSGSIARRTGSSTTFGPPGSIAEMISVAASAWSSVPRSAPQWMMAGSCPSVTSSTSETPSDRRAIMQLARPTMVSPSAGGGTIKRTTLPLARTCPSLRKPVTANTA